MKSGISRALETMEATNLHSMDIAFLQTINKTVHKNLANEHFGVIELSREIGLSRSQIHRKLYRINGKSVTQFIREIRLEKALKLLNENVGTVSEIAYQVGFSSPTYFNKCFHDYFGFPPGRIRKKNEIIDELNRSYLVDKNLSESVLFKRAQLAKRNVKDYIPKIRLNEYRGINNFSTSPSIFIVIVLLLIILILIIGIYVNS